MEHKKVAVIAAVMAFHPGSGPCAADADHPHCPGPH
jgi:hypothetical protein